jgi:hypothetical protein
MADRPVPWLWYGYNGLLIRYTPSVLRFAMTGDFRWQVNSNLARANGGFRLMGTVRHFARRYVPDL